MHACPLFARPALLTLALAGLSPWVAPARAEALPEDRGPAPVAELDAGALALDGVMIPVRVYYPGDAAAPVPVVAVVHGFFRNGSYMAELARTLASRGVVALVPDMPCNLRGCDHDANARQLTALLEWGATQANTDPSSPLFGKIDGSRRGVVGHSWGGLSSFLATARDPSIRSALLLDPNDDRGMAAAIAGTLPIPTAHVMAEDIGNCNNTLWGTTVFPLTPAPHLRVRVVGSGHCDVEDPTDAICPTFCSNPAHRDRAPFFRRYAIAWTLCNLTADPTMAPWVGGPLLDADVQAGTLDAVEAAGLDALPCRVGLPPSPDAGPRADATSAAPDATSTRDAAELPTDAAPRADASDPVDAGSSAPTDAGSLADAGPVAAAAADGCTTAPGPEPALLAALLLLLARRRRA